MYVILYSRHFVISSFSQLSKATGDLTNLTQTATKEIYSGEQIHCGALTEDDMANVNYRKFVSILLVIMKQCRLVFGKLSRPNQ